jgi:hypothetical protein
LIHLNAAGSFLWRSIQTNSASAVVGMPSEHEKLKAMADECRKLAAMLEQAAVRSRLLAIAERLEQWARESHRNGAGQS